jgi:hypothetical protein
MGPSPVTTPPVSTPPWLPPTVPMTGTFSCIVLTFGGAVIVNEAPTPEDLNGLLESTSIFLESALEAHYATPETRDAMSPRKERW